MVAAAVQARAEGRLPREEPVPEPERHSGAPDVEQARAVAQLRRVPERVPEPVLEPAPVPPPAARERPVARRPAGPEALRTSDRSPTAAR